MDSEQLKHLQDEHKQIAANMGSALFFLNQVNYLEGQITDLLFEQAPTLGLTTQQILDRIQLLQMQQQTMFDSLRPLAEQWLSDK